MKVLVKYRPYFCKKFNRYCAETVREGGCKKDPYLCEFKEELIDMEHQKTIFIDNVQKFEFCENSLGWDKRVVNIDDNFGFAGDYAIADYVKVDDELVFIRCLGDKYQPLDSVNYKDWDERCANEIKAAYEANPDVKRQVFGE